MNTQLFINTAAQSLAAALVRSLTDMTPVALPELVIGDTRAFDLYFVDGLGGYASFSGDASYQPSLAIGEFGFPTGGTFTLSFGGYTTGNLAYNAPLATVQAALQGLTSIGAGNCKVTGVPGEYYIVEFTGALADAPQAAITADFSLLTPDSTVEVSITTAGSVSPPVDCVQLLSLTQNPIIFSDSFTTISHGWTGTLSLNTIAALEALIAARPAAFMTQLFEVEVTDPSGDAATYFEGNVKIYDTIINPSAFAGAQAPVLATLAQLQAAILGLNNFTWQTAAPAVPGDTNISPPATSRYHSAVVTPSGGAGTYNLSLLTSQAPAAGALIRLSINPPATAGLVFKIYNATTGGTLLKTITTDDTGSPFEVIAGFTGSAWIILADDSPLLTKLGNLAGLASTLAAKINLATLFSQLANKSAAFVIDPTEEGTLFMVSAAGGAVVATLPAAATAGAGFLVAVKKTDTSAYTVTTSPATYSLTAQGDTVVLESDGSNWKVVLYSNTAGSGGTVTPSVFRLDAVVNGNGLGVTGLTGGGATKLDGLPTSDGTYQAGAMIEVVEAGPLVLTYRLRAGTDAQNVPWIVRPADYNGVTNQLVWELLRVVYQGYPVIWNHTQSKWQAISASGTPGSERISFGTGFVIN
jgi:hypothetical protein